MKIAITSQGKSLDSKLDHRFGRAAYFIVYDTEKDTYEVSDNSLMDSGHGAGTGSAQFVAQSCSKKVICAKFGGKAQDLLVELGIETVAVGEIDITIQELIKKYK